MASSSINDRAFKLDREDVCDFGLDVLKLLEATEEWDGDTFDLISETARKYGLATTDSSGYFMIKGDTNES